MSINNANNPSERAEEGLISVESRKLLRKELEFLDEVGSFFVDSLLGFTFEKWACIMEINRRDNCYEEKLERGCGRSKTERKFGLLMISHCS